MSRQKNASRTHEIAPWTSDDAAAPTAAYLDLGHFITTISDDSEEKTDTSADYAGDGNEVEVLTGRSEKWTVEGTYDPADPAHALIASMKRNTTDEGRQVWHRITESNGDVIEGVAKALNIVAGGGDAAEFEEFKFDLAFVATPTVTQAEA
jgi:hypothetical protein